MAVMLQYQIVATIAEFGDFDNVDGGNPQAPATDYFPAGARIAQKLQGTMSVGEITVARGYDPERDKTLIDYCNAFWRGSLVQPRPITIKEKNAQNVVVATRDYAACKPVSLSLPSGQSGSNGVAMISVTWAVEQLV